MRRSNRARLTLVSLCCAAAALTACLGEPRDPIGVGGTSGGGVNFTIAAVSGDNQSAPPGAALPDSLVVRVTSPAGAAPNVVVSWAVLSGGGTVAPTSVATDAAGLAKARLALGATPGSALVRASISGVAGASVDLRATAR